MRYLPVHTYMHSHPLWSQVVPTCQHYSRYQGRLLQHIRSNTKGQNSAAVTGQCEHSQACSIKTQVEAWPQESGKCAVWCTSWRNVCPAKLAIINLTTSSQQSMWRAYSYTVYHIYTALVLYTYKHALIIYKLWLKVANTLSVYPLHYREPNFALHYLSVCSASESPTDSHTDEMRLYWFSYRRNVTYHTISASDPGIG